MTDKSVASRRSTAMPAVLAVFVCLLAANLRAQSVGDQAEAGPDASISFDVNRAAGEVWYQATPVVEYTFSPRWSAELGLPLYYLTAGATEEGTGQVGIGDVYISGSLTSSSVRRTLYTTITVSAPTGSVDKGLGAGQTSWDWTGSVSGQIGSIAPYANLGVGNNTKASSETLGASNGAALPGAGISVGTLAHVEGGVEFTLAKALSFTASAYGIFASSRVTSDTSDTNDTGQSVSDHGVAFVLWNQVTPSLDMSLWVTRSLAYSDYTAVSVNATININRPRRIRH